MFKLIFNDDKKAHKSLAKAQRKINKFSKKHAASFNKKEHKKFRKLLKKRATAISKSTGLEIHSLFD